MIGQFTIVIVFDRTMKHCLMCKRTKHPYIEMYDFVGGKIENGESAVLCAKREFKEETGISPENLTFYPLSELLYNNYRVYINDDHQSNIVVGTKLYVYSTVLKTDAVDTKLIEEKNPLVWFDTAQTDFYNVIKFAGDGNAGHLIDIAMIHYKPMFEQMESGCTSNCIEDMCWHLRDHTLKDTDKLICMSSETNIEDPYRIKHCPRYKSIEGCVTCTHSLSEGVPTLLGSLDSIIYRCELQDYKITYQDTKPFNCDYADIPKCEIDKFEKRS